MRIFETIIYRIQFSIMNVKYWIRSKLGFKELIEDPIKVKWMFYRLNKKHKTNGKELSQEQVEDMLKDI